MDTCKSQFQVYLDLAVCTITQDPLKLCHSKTLARDCRTVSSRVASEGVSFLVRTLPKLGRALDQGLETGRLQLPREFRKESKGVSRPAFMQAYFRRVFDDQGCLLSSPDADAVRHLRQVMFMFYKLELPFSTSQANEVCTSFVETEIELEDFRVPCTDVLDIATWIISEVFDGFNPFDIRPRHGPGAVATGERLDQKWTFGRYYYDLHSCYPFVTYMRTNFDHTLDSWDEMQSLQRCESGVAKVVLVPKDSRGPRLISCEPLEYQWIQQGLGRSISDWLENHPLTSGRINFSSQEINRNLALKSSVDRSYATLDLKDASDRNSLDLVRYLFRERLDILKCLEASRTTATKLPNGSIVSLNKFAPMGSACCFPIEAVCFWSIIVAARVFSERLTVSEAGVDSYVYGDDIIVPTNSASTCIQALESAGLVVNTSKSCIEGYFRESCGMDAFKGVQVTPIRIKTLWSGHRSDGSAYVSYVAYSNSLFEKGYTKASQYIVDLLTKMYGEQLPYGLSSSPFPCIEVSCPFLAEELNLHQLRSRYNAPLQRQEFYVRFVTPKKVQTKLDSWERLLRNVISGELVDPTNVVLPYSTQIKYGWKSV